MCISSLDIKRLCLINHWQEDRDGPQWYPTFDIRNHAIGIPSPKFIKDCTTDDLYLNESKRCIRQKCLLAFVGSLFAHPATVLIHVIWRIIKFISFYELWKKNEVSSQGDHQQANEKQPTLKYRVAEYIKDFLRIMSSPLVIPLLSLSALYGIIRPYDGRKLHGNIEIAFYGKSLFSPCFAPKPKEHFFGGDIDNPNAW